jgi:hypothetical protein
MEPNCILCQRPEPGDHARTVSTLRHCKQCEQAMAFQCTLSDGDVWLTCRNGHSQRVILRSTNPTG